MEKNEKGLTEMVNYSIDALVRASEIVLDSLGEVAPDAVYALKDSLYVLSQSGEDIAEGIVEEVEHSLPPDNVEAQAEVYRTLVDFVCDRLMFRAPEDTKKATSGLYLTNGMGTPMGLSQIRELVDNRGLTPAVAVKQCLDALGCLTEARGMYIERAEDLYGMAVQATEQGL